MPPLLGGRGMRTIGNLWAFNNDLFARRDLLGVLGANQSNTIWVDSTNGSNGFDGSSAQYAVATITKALEMATAGDFIMVLPGQYDESPTVVRTTHSKLTIIGVGNRGSVYIEPSTEDADGLTVNADDVTIINIGCAAEDDSAGNYALIVTGSRFRAFGCKFEGGEQQVRFGPGTVAQEAAGTHGRGGDCLFDDCEFAWGTYGFVVVGTDYGAATQVFVQNCRFHNIATACVFEVVGSGGSAGVLFRNLQLRDCIFDDSEGGTAPTFYVDLNGDNANDGIVAGCQFPTAINSGLNLVSTALHWVGNFHTGGISTAQPS